MKYDDINYSLIPEHMKHGVKLYLEKGIPPGSFLTAVLENNLTETIGRADKINQVHIVDWVKFLWCEMPRESWGSKEKVKNWIESKSAK